MRVRELLRQCGDDAHAITELRRRREERGGRRGRGRGACGGGGALLRRRREFRKRYRHAASASTRRLLDVDAESLGGRASASPSTPACPPSASAYSAKQRGRRSLARERVVTLHDAREGGAGRCRCRCRYRYRCRRRRERRSRRRGCETLGGAVHGLGADHVVAGLDSHGRAERYLRSVTIDLAKLKSEVDSNSRN